MPPSDGPTHLPTGHCQCCAKFGPHVKLAPGSRGYVVLPLPHVRDVVTLAAVVCALAVLVPIIRERVLPSLLPAVGQLVGAPSVPELVMENYQD